MVSESEAIVEGYVLVVREALNKLHKAQLEMRKNTFPGTPLPRPKYFQSSDKSFVWPYFNEQHDFLQWEYAKFIKENVFPQVIELTRDGFAKSIVTSLAQPSRIYEIVNLLEQATKWCNDRTEGRQRHAANIMVQQQKAVDELRKRLVIIKMRQGGK